MHPEAWVAEHVRAKWTYVDGGRDFERHRGDCWALVIEIQRKTFRRALPEVDEYETVEDRSGVAAAAEKYQTPEWAVPVPAGSEIPGDIIFVKVQNGWPIHAGVVAGPQCFVHLCNRGVRIEPYNKGLWRNKVSGFWRPCRPLA